MAIKDSLIDNILKTGNNPLASKSLYKRLRPDVENNMEKQDTNQTQTEHKQDTKARTNQTQTGHKRDTNLPLLTNHNTDIRHKPNTQLNTQSDTNQTQTKYKPDTKQAFSSLVGLQRQVLLFLFNDCKITRSNTTQEMSLLYISDNLKIRVGSIKTTLARLVQKQFITPIGFKNGRGGWHKYELPDGIYKELIHIEHRHKLDTNRAQTEYKQSTELDTKLDTSVYSSSSNINNKTTTTGEIKNLPEEWQVVCLDSLNDIGFTTTHLAQIAYQQKLSPEIIQDSIEAFAFDLKYNQKARTLKGSPLNYFMGIIRNGQPYAPPGNYESPQDREMRLYLERKKKIEQVRAEREEELVKIAFDEWDREQSEEYKQSLLPEDISHSRFLGPKQAALRSYFNKEIWPEKRKELNRLIEESLLNKKMEPIENAK